MITPRKIIFTSAIALQFLVLSASFGQFSKQYYGAQYPGLIKHVDPDYPPELYRRGIGGRGIFLLKVNAQGDVDEVKIVRSTGVQLLNELAAKAFFQWKFEPGVARQIKIPYEFHTRGYSRVLH